jgi:hypothetical protein
MDPESATLGLAVQDDMHGRIFLLYNTVDLRQEIVSKRMYAPVA